MRREFNVVFAVCVLMLSVACDRPVPGFRFEKVSLAEPLPAMRTLYTGQTIHRLSCASACLRVPHCSGFETLPPGGGACRGYFGPVPGTTALPARPYPKPPPTFGYRLPSPNVFGCPTHSGFAVYYGEGTAYCLARRPARKWYREAQLDCQSLDGQVMFPASMDKLAVAFRNFGETFSGNIWLGAEHNDLTDSWTGAVVGNELQSLAAHNPIWAPGQPSYPLYFPCTISGLDLNHRIATERCELANEYVCEMPLN